MESKRQRRYLRGFLDNGAYAWTPYEATKPAQLEVARVLLMGECWRLSVCNFSYELAASRLTTPSASCVSLRSISFSSSSDFRRRLEQSAERYYDFTGILSVYQVLGGLEKLRPRTDGVD